MKTIRRSKYTIFRYKYQTDSRYFAQTSAEVSDLAAMELKQLGAKDISTAYRGVHFQADTEHLYRINYYSRLISRILAPLHAFACPDTDALYREGKTIPWERFFLPKTTFAVFANVSNSEITHSKYAALRLKDAIVDSFRERTGSRPNVDTSEADLQFHLHIRDNQAEISIDTSGGPLHKRGYREETIAAPMQETIAAAILQHAGWDGDVPLVDPMCGSGTILCEALMKYCRIPAGIFRKQFGFEHLPDFQPALWKEIQKQAAQTIRPLPRGWISGSDRSQQAVQATRTNLMGILHGNQVSVETMDFRNRPSQENCVIVTNPPYGIRIGGRMDLGAFYRDIGDFLKQKCKGSAAYVYFGERKYIKNMGLKAAWKKPLKNGGLDGRLVKYEMY